MNKLIANTPLIIAAIFTIAAFTACSKSGTSAPTLPPDACAGKNIVITTTLVVTAHCSNDGSIDIAATGSTGFTYKLNSGGTYQTASKFSDLAEGAYTVYVKDAAGCEKSASVTVNSVGSAGAQFTSMKTLVAARCQSCHNNSIANGGMNFEIECNIIKNKARIKVRAVDEGTMPQTGSLTQAEKDVISNWIAGGGTYTN